VHKVEPGGALIIEVGERPLLELLGALVILRDDARVTDGADAFVVGVVNVSGPGSVNRAGEFEDFFFRPLRRVEPVVAKLVELFGRLGDGFPLVVGRPGKWEGLEAGRRRMARSSFESCAQPERPDLVQERMW